MVFMDGISREHQKTMVLWLLRDPGASYVSVAAELDLTAGEVRTLFMEGTRERSATRTPETRGRILNTISGPVGRQGDKKQPYRPRPSSPRWAVPLVAQRSPQYGLDVPMSSMDAACSLGRRHEDPLAEAIRTEAWTVLSSSITALPDRQRLIMERRFLTDAPATFDELGIMLGITRERVRQLMLKGIGNIKSVLSAADLDVADFRGEPQGYLSDSWYEAAANRRRRGRELRYGYLAGMAETVIGCRNLAEAAEHLGTSESEAWRALNALSVPMPGDGDGRPSEDSERPHETRAKTYAEWLSLHPGATYGEAADHFGVSPMTVCRAANRHGLNRRGRQHITGTEKTCIAGIVEALRLLGRPSGRVAVARFMRDRGLWDNGGDLEAGVSATIGMEKKRPEPRVLAWGGLLTLPEWMAGGGPNRPTVSEPGVVATFTDRTTQAGTTLMRNEDTDVWFMVGEDGRRVLSHEQVLRLAEAWRKDPRILDWQDGPLPPFGMLGACVDTSVG